MLFAVAAGGCGQGTGETFEPFVERMPGPASVWLTSDPEAPDVPVPVTMRSPDDPGILFRHTFVSGETLRGDFATSQGRYLLAAFGGACSIDLVLGPSDVAEVRLTLGDTSCSLTIERIVDMEDPTAQRDEPSVFITNQGVSETPFIEPVAPSQ
jgi:hypothetical protein